MEDLNKHLESRKNNMCEKNPIPLLNNKAAQL